jgi:hypothetical protein
MKDEQAHTNKGFTAETEKCLEISRQSLHVPSNYFESRSVLLESNLKDILEVPDGFYEGQSNLLITKIQEASANSNTRTIRLWIPLAAASVMVSILFMLIPGKEQAPSFSAQLEQATIEFEDLEELDFDEEVYEEFIILDTIKPDSSSTVKKPVSVNDFKPSKGQSVISWDDISAEDIEEYLKEEETLEIIDEL